MFKGFKKLHHRQICLFLLVLSAIFISWKFNFLREVSLGANSTITTMDSYLIEYGEKKLVFVTSLEMPISLSNKKLPLRGFEISGESLVPMSVNLPTGGYHVRSIFQTRPNGSNIFVMDHGLDMIPFPGGSTDRLNLATREIYSYKEMEGKFNFAGDSLVFQGATYDVFVGINFLLIYRDGKSLDLGDLLSRIGDPQGFLSSVLFERDGKLHLFLGISDIYPHDHAESVRYDYLVDVSHPDLPVTKLQRLVPWNWATVYAALQDVPSLGRILKVSYHNPGFNKFQLGYYLIDEGFKFQEIKIPNLPDLVNNWVSRFEFRVDGSQEIIAHVKIGSGGGKLGALFLKADSASQAHFTDLCLVGVHHINSQVYGVSCDLRLVKL